MPQAGSTSQSRTSPTREGADSVCLSLGALAKTARTTSGWGRGAGGSATLYGLNFVKGYVVDDANHDIVLYGSRMENRPPIFLGDLCVCVQNLWHPERSRYAGQQYPSPFCSLDPRNGAMAAIGLVIREFDASRLNDGAERARAIGRLTESLGPQMIRVGGVPRDVRLAHVMIDADYHMKKVSQGHLPFPRVQSCAGLCLARQRRTLGLLASIGRVFGIGQSPGGARMSRFWFHLDKNHPAFVQSSGIVEIDKCAMVVLTERQVSAHDGALVDGGGADPDAREFAESMSAQLRVGAARVREYADLENLYRLFALLKAIQFAGAETKAGLDLRPLLECPPRRFEMRDALPALANIATDVEATARGKRWFCSLVCGGVSLNVSLTARKFRATRGGSLVREKRSIIGSRPDSRSVFWVASQSE